MTKCYICGNLMWEGNLCPCYTHQKHPDVKPMGAVTISRNGYIEELIAQRDALKEALIEMRYGHTDKAESMAIAALASLENVPAHPVRREGQPDTTQPL